MNLSDPCVAEVIPHAFSEAEIAWIEDNFPAMSPTQPADFCSAFESVEVVRNMALLPETMGMLMNDFTAAAKWHQAFNRPALAEKYQRIVDTIGTVLKEKLT
jgi:hypothetical protein